MTAPWEPDFFPQWLWDLMFNLGLFAAVVAVLSAIAWLWKKGPELLIKHGWEWMTKLGEWWQGRRG